MKILKLSVLALMFPCFGLLAEEPEQGQEKGQKEEEVDKSDDAAGNYLDLAENDAVFFGKKFKFFHGLLTKVLGADLANKVAVAKMEEKGKRLRALMKRVGADDTKIEAVLAALKEKFEAKMKAVAEGGEEEKASGGEEGDEGKTDMPTPAEEPTK